jgi:hypothetical protein
MNTSAKSAGWPELPWATWATPHWYDLKYHVDKHPMCLDRTDPYRRCPTHQLSEAFFRAALDADTDPDISFDGCLDAPEYIPLGSTQRVTTLGDYEREHYERGYRECGDWKAAARARIATAKMLREILDEAERKDGKP